MVILIMEIPQQKTELTRRSVARGAAWAVPVVVASATVPAVAASRCTTQTFSVDWSRWTRTPPSTATPLSSDRGSMTVVGSAGGTLTIFGDQTANAAILSGSQDLQGPSSGNLPTNPSSGLKNPLMFQHLAGSTPQRATATFTFSRPVTNLSFSIGDIDGGPGNRWSDRVSLSSGFTVTSLASGVTGSGTAASPFAPNGSTNLSYTQTTGNVTVNYASASSFTLTFANATGFTGAQNIVIGPMTFTACA